MADLTIVAQKLAEDVKQWMFIKIGDATGPILPATGFVEEMENRYSLKNTQKNQFLVWQDGKAGIDMGFIDEMRSRWIFSRCGASTEPLKYGDTIAIGYGKQPTWVNFEEQTFGINLGFQKTPSCEWRIMGGPIGTLVQTNERVALFNEKSKASATEFGEFLIFFDRPPGHADIGWPTSQTFVDNLGEVFKDHSKEIVTLTIAALS
jgi:hypothetical protein